MKKWTCCILAAALLLSLATGVYAAEVTGCVISADSVTAEAGAEVTVPIRVSDNSGATNFSIRLYYDREALTLKTLENGAWDLISVNPDGIDEEKTACTVVVGASAGAVTGESVLVNAVFTVNADFTGTTQITPAVNYIRNNSAVFSVFEEITATVESGTVEVGAGILLGDVNGDGTINLKDAMLVRAYINKRNNGGTTFEQAADVNGDGKIDMRDAMMIYAYANNKLAAFPGGQSVSKEETT